MAIAFDASNKRIILDSGAVTASQIWIAWIDWVSLSDNSKYLPALRQVGGDQLGSGLLIPPYIFLINGWRVRPMEMDHDLVITGNLFVDGGGVPVVRTLGQFQVNVNYTVPVQAQAIYTGGTSLTAEQIRQEIDNNSTKLTEILAKESEIIDSLANISVSSSAINTPAIEFSLVSGTVVSGTITDTRGLNNSAHIITRNSSLLFDVNYKFDIGLNSIPSEFTFTGKISPKQHAVQVDAWNYDTSAWENIGSISGSSTYITQKFVLYQPYVGKLPSLIGDVKIRFHTSTAIDVTLEIDQLFISYATVEKAIGYSEHAVSATSKTVQLSQNASNLDNYYVPALLYVNHGTGQNQYAKVIGYTGSTRTLQLELPMVMTLDTTSHITLMPWASASVDNTGIATAVWGQSVSDMTDKTTIGGYISKILLSVPKYLGLK